MINNAKRLHDLGFAVHWLKSNSKKPTELGWTKGPRKKWQELEDSYTYGLNMGVRLGKPSKFPDGTYLAVIDCDVKSDLPAHQKAMEQELVTRFGKPILEAPTVFSGRGNGSRHVYIRTKEPARPKRVTQDRTKVRVQMPSVKASKADQEVLNPSEIEEGFRMRAAWEISFMGQGQQVVVPPSIHPDTGNAYQWANPIQDFKDIPLVELSAADLAPEKLPTLEDFDAEEVDLVGSGLSPEIGDLILSGAGCDDRSAGLLKAATAMLKKGFTRNQILSVLTDKDTFLGEAAYEHAQTTSRKRAAQWVLRYTLLKAEKETLAENQFKDAAEIEPLPPEEAKAQAEELFPDKGGADWEETLDYTGEGPARRPKPTLQNLKTIFTMAVDPMIFRKNLFLGTDVYGVDAPWNDAKAGQELRDIDLVNIAYWLASEFRFEAAVPRILMAVNQIASENQFHPVRDFLDDLQWDGVERLSSWLKTYLGATGPEPYLSEVSKTVLCAMVARVMVPGVKYDQVLILEGIQGVGKSSAVRILGAPWYSDTHINIADKDAVVAMRAVWVMEMGELSGMRKAEVELLKEFISRQTDRIRLPYGKLAENFPRQCIFIGTTNSDEYLKDLSGNRRFWPIKVGKVDFAGLERDRDQLLAEARFTWDLWDGPLDLQDPLAKRQAIEEQGARLEVDAWNEIFQAWLETEAKKPKEERMDLDRIKLSHLFDAYGPFSGWKANVPELRRAANVLRQFEYKRKIDNKGCAFWEKQTIPDHEQS